MSDYRKGSVTKKHFSALDGLRGVAAIGVVLFHFMEIVAPDYHDSFIPHSYLAVDFFFCFSGFVIAYAYDDRLDKIGKKDFFKRRLIRLHPMVVVGAIIGLLAFVFDPFSDLKDSFSTLQLLLMFLSACFLIPYPAVPQRYFNLFHLNPPTWSLFWEYIGNIIYAFFLVKASKRVLWTILIISALLLCYESYKSGYLAVGFGGDNFWGGGVRLSFSFTAGILVFRQNWLFHKKVPFFLLTIALSAVFFIPYSEWLSPIVDPLLAIFYFPFLIALSAAADHLKQKTIKACKWLGDISYPLYVVHYPFIWIFMSYVEKVKPNKMELTVTVSAGMLFLIILSHFILKWIDEPIRQSVSAATRTRSTKVGVSKLV